MQAELGTLKIIDLPVAGSVQTLGGLSPLRLQTYGVAMTVDVAVSSNYRRILSERYSVPPHTTAPVDLSLILRCVFDFHPPALSRAQVPQASDNLKDIDITLTAYSGEGISEGSASTHFYLLRCPANNLTVAACTGNLLTVGPSVRRVPEDHITVVSFYARRAYGRLMCEASDGKTCQIAAFASAWGMVDVVVDFRRLSSLFTLRGIVSYYFYMEGREGNGTLYIIDNRRPRGERWYYFLNSLGGVDCISACGRPVDKHKYQSKNALREGWTVEYDIDITRTVNDNSGYMAADSQRTFFRDFLASSHKYVREEMLLRRIVVEEATADATRLEASQATFAWRYSDPEYPSVPRLESWCTDRGEAGPFRLAPAFALPYHNRELRVDFLWGERPYNMGGVSGGHFRDYYWRVSPRIKKYLRLGEAIDGNTSLSWPAGEVAMTAPPSVVTGFLVVGDRITGAETTCMLVLKPEG